MDNVLRLLPDFALIVLGCVLRRVLLREEGFWAGLERLVYFVLFPALMFNALVSMQFDPATALPLLLAALLAMGLGCALGWLGRPWMGLAPLAFASRLQTAFRFNTYIGMAVAGKLHGAAGMALMGGVCGTMVPFANVLAVSFMVRHSQGGLWRELARNPLVLATVLGIFWNLSGVPVPAPAHAILARLGDAAIALGLLAVGAALRWGAVTGKRVGAAWLVVVKLLLLPACAWGLGRLLGVSGIAFDVLVLFAALPSASSAYILATRLGGDGPGVAWLVSATTILSALSMMLWLQLLQAG